ncbi:signal-induced proliferation-associated 1-like protein 3 isoform X1 [Carassius auratus]|uniref:Signal-induced proliferation-associated 1-like protein 3 isoform X1 n=1 Tax=Carassius auratus TaxID=7957 RepID=A0A6P6RE29_CARAU|nr:signal-induced proliferation-associated 1-like protein 3 isoform X1 [Carassius auratus]XP_026143458.1 signal-induced proliferation-associated 1-like protein 3 isoform X1 [Carassius auratus]XP_026143459.1 signal-induced proliferation-associated 1-like protein 3 isoform X1 [Carassius auratus]
MNMYRDTGVCATPLSQPLPPPHLRLPLHNGHSSVGDPAPSRVSVPKMGVRARIAEWPPRRALSRESLLENGQGSQPDDLNSEDGLTRGGMTRLPQRGTRDGDILESGLTMAPGTPPRFRMSGFAPLRQRSTSEITLSEQDETEVEGCLFREYGSTSSINVQAVSDQSFFDMLSQFQQERPDQRSTAPVKLGELLGALEGPTSHTFLSTPRPDDRPENRVRKKSGGTESSLGTSSLFRKLRSSSRGETETPRGDSDDIRPPVTLSSKPWVCVRSFAHFDAQSVLFDLHEAAARRSYAAQRRNTATGASAASSAAVSLAVSRAIALGGVEPSFSSTDDLSVRDLSEGSTPALELSEQGSSAGVNANSQHQLLLSCPNFINETGSYTERNVSFLSSSAERAEAGIVEARLRPRCSNASVSKLEVPQELQATRLERLQQHCIEHVDLGARYYHEHFYEKEHWNYFGTDEKLGPVALSIRREKLDDTKDFKDQYQYRIIFRTNELVTLRGAILEDAILSTAKHGTVRGLPLKEVLEYVLPELSVSCLRLALSTPKVTEQLLKLDEQGLSQKHKVGILLCRAGQSTEEEMYNNEEATPAFTAFLELLGETVCLRGFNKYAAQLDTKTDSTGTHSLYTTYQDYEIMFHVSTMLPYMPNNPQQLLRKRHIGNDIVTIIFQEPGAQPFTPQNIRSHFQHVFVIVRVHNPCSDNTCYSVAVTRMKDVPPFGPALPSNGMTFRDPAAFRAFLLAKIINAENAAHKSEKFHAMATRTRQGYLRDLAENCVSTTPLDTAGKLNNLISLASKRKERIRPREGAEMGALGALIWRVLAQDFSGGGAELPCALAISNEYIVLADCSTKEVVFNCFCADVIGWTAERLALKIFYGRGDHVALRVPEGSAPDIREVVQRLKALTIGCETVDMTLRRNGLGQLGFHVRLDGTVSEVEEYGFAWQAGLRQGSRLVEICKVAAVTLSHEQMIDLLRTSVTVKVVIIPPFEEGGARRGCTEEYEMKMMEQKGEAEPVAAGYRSGQRTPVWRWDSPPGTHSSAQRWTPSGAPPVPSRTPKALIPIPFREPQHISAKRPVSYPENHYSVSPLAGDRVMPYRNPSASFSSPGSGFISSALGVPGLSGPFVLYKPTRDGFGSVQRPLQPFDPHITVDVSSGESSSGFTSQESTMERNKSEPMWHVPASSRGVSVGSAPRRQTRQDVAGKDSPNRHSKGEAHYSSHSSSNTLSSNASSSHSDERWFDSVGGVVSGALSDPSDPDPDHMGKGGSSDSGIDASLYTPSPNTKGAKPSRSLAGTPHKPLHGSATYSGLQELSGAGGEGRRRESSPIIASANQSKNYRTRTFPPPGSANVDNFKPRTCYTPQGYKTPAVADKPRPVRSSTVTPTSGSAQLSNSTPKSLSKTKSAWQQEENSAATSTTSTDSNSNKQVDMNSKNVFGQPRLRASLRDLRSPRRSHKSTIEDDLKKLIIMDNPTETPSRDGSPHRTLQRTFSDESLCSGRRDSSYASTPLFEGQVPPSDLLFTCTLPTRRHGHNANHGALVPSKKVPLSASELSLTEVRDKVPPLRRLDPGLMPLPDTACGLEWSSLVNAAKAYEVQRAVSLFSLSESHAGGNELRPVISPVHFHTPQTPRTTPTFSGEEVPNDLSGRLNHLEVMLKQLNNDLEKEKQDKATLLAEMANLRQNNQRLQEESHSASEQLRKFSKLLSSTIPERK